MTEPTAAARTSSRRPLLFAALAALLLAVAGAGGYLVLRDGGDDSKPAPVAATSAPAAKVVTGTLTLTDEDGIDWSSSAGCFGTGGYDDVRSGAQVVITDPAGKTVALGKLDQGVLDGTVPGRTADLCKFTFAVTGVPTGHGFYGVEVAHRGRVQYPEQQLFAALSLTLG